MLVLVHLFWKPNIRRQNKIRKENSWCEENIFYCEQNTNFVKKTKLAELEDKVEDVSSLATKTALTAVENKIPSVSSLVRKTNYDTKITEIEKKLTDHNHDKFITTPELNTLAASVLNARLAQADLITKTDFAAKLLSLNRKITSNKRKHFLTATGLEPRTT